ncbi:hypothetical protein JHK85_008495 [Glycine max]|uniref:Uncharacterized protein n=1 Tax=Glycine soja TaxID=3848 RepID=A0A0B2Q307_GLYSO|nr:hypothetical protein JHK85_008495 [Glycine max]KHN14187.1 hypothetical protein glysoja_028585 [Glycine soja]
MHTCYFVNRYYLRRAASCTQFLSSFVCHERLTLTQGMNVGEPKCSSETCKAVGYTAEECYSISSKGCISICLFWRVCKG